MNRKLLVPTLVLVGLSPALQGAGCTAHYTARMTGTVSVANDRPANEGAVIVMYRLVDGGTESCADDPAACVSADGWRRFVSCEGQEESVLTPSNGRVAFELCTRMVGIDYHADVLAFVDKNGNLALDPGEQYGLFTGGPMSRHGEANQVTIAVDQTR